MKTINIEGLEKYLIDEDGRIYSTITNKYLKTSINRKGYEGIKLNKKSYRIHRLVAITYIENPNNLPQVNHKDGDKSNNNVSNLEWCTNGENQLHAFATGLNKAKKPKNRSLTDLQADEIRKEYLTSNTSQRKLAIKYNVSKTTIADILNCRYYNFDKDKEPIKMQKTQRKLTLQDAEDIRQRHKEGYSISSLSKKYNMTWKSVKKIIDYKTYNK
ncbi:helix-turn-helix domain of resolvase family protein (plasmid) [Clostridium baratii str. Sullivan]|uniref:Helix-turn-helix domain of resolvase family protein n=1 Tax=Clostridium baratii str. Sullivan TaxID=1415775 RepID=A0A0A7G0K1_9CLOT|nr:HNH endonuclease signature motif containing protein [Clostridium baratii]AIY85357.1 helix-turn-helix domain of resolvase family protein [Clostridium baratii str. Sullivan]